MADRYDPSKELELWNEKVNLGFDTGPVLRLISYDHGAPRLDMKDWNLGPEKTEKFFRLPRLKTEQLETLIVALTAARKKMDELNLRPVDSDGMPF